MQDLKLVFRGALLRPTLQDAIIYVNAQLAGRWFDGEACNAQKMETTFLLKRSGMFDSAERQKPQRALHSAPRERVVWELLVIE